MFRRCTFSSRPVVPAISGRTSDVAAPLADDRRPDAGGFGIAFGRTHPIDRRVVQGLFGLPRRTFRQVLFLGRDAAQRLRHDRQVPCRRRCAVPQYLRVEGVGVRRLLPDPRTVGGDPPILGQFHRRSDAFGGETPFPGCVATSTTVSAHGCNVRGSPTAV